MKKHVLSGNKTTSYEFFKFPAFGLTDATIDATA